MSIARGAGDLTFDSLAVGRGSAVAHAAAWEVAQQPGAHNPLFIHGEPGTGKTHVLFAIYHQLRDAGCEPGPDSALRDSRRSGSVDRGGIDGDRGDGPRGGSGSSGMARDGAGRGALERPGFRHPDPRPRAVPGDAKPRRLEPLLVTGECFCNEFLSAIERRELDSFRARYRSAQALLIDDLQFLSAKVRTLEELFHTFQALLSRGRQIVVTSNRPLREIRGASDRLLSLLQGGLIAPLARADQETRQRILSRRCSRLGYDLPEETAQFLASHVSSNLRELDGAVTHLVGLARLHGTVLSLALARQALAAIQGEERPPEHGAIRVDIILRLLADYFGMRQREILSSSKVRSIVYARQLGMYLARELTPLSLEQIGLQFGGKDHTTVLYARDCIQRQLERNPRVLVDLQVLRSRLAAGLPHPQ